MFFLNQRTAKTQAYARCSCRAKSKEIKAHCSSGGRSGLINNQTGNSRRASPGPVELALRPRVRTVRGVRATQAGLRLIKITFGKSKFSRKGSVSPRRKIKEIKTGGKKFSSVNGDGRVGIDAVGRDVAEDGMKRTPECGALEQAVGFEGDDRPLGDARDHVTEFFVELGRQTAGFRRTHLNRSPSRIRRGLELVMVTERLKARGIGFEKFGLFGGRGPSQRAVARGKAAEALDRGLVPERIGKRIVRFAEAFARQPHAGFLIGQILRMRQRKIIKAAHAGRRFNIVAAGKCALGDRARQRI